MSSQAAPPVELAARVDAVGAVGTRRVVPVVVVIVMLARVVPAVAVTASAVVASVLGSVVALVDAAVSKVVGWGMHAPHEARHSPTSHSDPHLKSSTVEY